MSVALHSRKVYRRLDPCIQWVEGWMITRYGWDVVTTKGIYTAPENRTEVSDLVVQSLYCVRHPGLSVRQHGACTVPRNPLSAA
jgi:hypothetical protein